MGSFLKAQPGATREKPKLGMIEKTEVEWQWNEKASN